eukprot:m51a1_g11283 hypothetical protein (133) ;mRNA; r:23677-24579
MSTKGKGKERDHSTRPRDALSPRAPAAKGPQRRWEKRWEMVGNVRLLRWVPVPVAASPVQVVVHSPAGTPRGVVPHVFSGGRPGAGVVGAAVGVRPVPPSPRQPFVVVLDKKRSPALLAPDQPSPKRQRIGT